MCVCVCVCVCVCGVEIVIHMHYTYYITHIAATHVENYSTEELIYGG